MALDFYSAYVLEGVAETPQVIFGIHPFEETIDGEPREALRFLTTSQTRPVAILLGSVEEVDPNTFEVATETGKATITYLTVDRFRALGAAGDILGWENIGGKFSTDGEVQQFYIQEFLMNYPWYIEEARESS